MPKTKSFAIPGAAVLALGGALLAGPASADVVFTLGNNPQPNEENILFQAPETGATVTGATNMTHVPVYFSSLTGQTLLQNAQGQADILQNVPMASQNSALTSMDINLTAPNFTPGVGVPNPQFGFDDFIMNPLNGSGTATVTAFDNFGQSFTYDLGNGQNYLTLTTVNGEFITDVQLVVTGGSFIEFKQPRISGICTTGPNDSCDIIPTRCRLPLRAAWLRPKQTPWSPIKGSSAGVSPNRLSYGCPTTIFRDPRNRHRHHLSATLLDGGLKRLGPVVTMRSRSLGRRVSECWL